MGFEPTNALGRSLTNQDPGWDSTHGNPWPLLPCHRNEPEGFSHYSRSNE